MERPVFTVSSAEDLALLRRRGRLRGRLEVQINLPGLDEARRADLQHRVEGSSAACGCNEGTVAGLIYLVLIPTLIFAGRLAPSFPLGWIAIGGGFIAVLAAGKLFGLVVARLALSRALNRIERAFRNHGKGLE